MSLCESRISTDHLILREPCKAEFSFTIYRQSRVKLVRDLEIVLTMKYNVSMEPIGFALGRHLYSLPLAPGEEVEIEVFRGAKAEREISQQCSTEVEFISEFAHTVKYDWSRERTSNYTEGGGVSGGINILGIIQFGGHSEDEYSETEKEFMRVIGEAVLKTKYRVDKKFDLHVGLKTEVENRYRSTKKIKNPNACRTLTYNYFQLMRKFRVTVTRTGIRFDYSHKLPRILTAYIPAVIRRYAMPPPAIKTLVATREESSQTTSTSNPGSTLTETVRTLARPMELSMTYRDVAEPQVSTYADVKTVMHPIVEESCVLELTKERLLSKMIKDGVVKDPKSLDVAIESLRNKFPIGKVSEKEICVNTNSMHAEPMMGLCLACEEHTQELQRLELEKAKSESE